MKNKKIVASLLAILMLAVLSLNAFAMEKDRYLEIRDKKAPATIDELAEADQYEIDNPDDEDVKRIVQARKDKEELDNAKETLKNKVNDSKYLSEEKKAELNNKIENAPLHDLITEEKLPAEIEKAEKDAKAELEKALEPTKDALRKANYESKLSDAEKDENGRAIADAESMEELEKIAEKLKVNIDGTKPVDPAKPDDKKEPEVKPEDDKKATVEENEDKKAEVKEEKTEPKKEVKANTPATGSEVVLAAITFGVSALGAVVTAAKRK